MSETPIIEVNDAGFESEVLQSEKPVIVAFRADWCGPCRAVEPVVEDLAEASADTVDVVRIDVDHNPQTPSYYGVKSIPTFLRFIDGEVADRVIGAVPRSRLEKLFRT